MNLINNKHGPDFDVGFPVARRPRDGTGRRPRDGTDGNPHDGTGRRPRDGTDRKARDNTTLRMGTLVNRFFYRLTGSPQDVHIHSSPCLKWRESVWGKPAFGTGNGRGMPIRSTNYE